MADQFGAATGLHLRITATRLVGEFATPKPFGPAQSAFLVRAGKLFPRA